MPSVQRFLSGRDNLARSAALTASSVRASTAIERVSADRTGGGRVRLAGSYVGHEATEVEVEIVNPGAGVPRASVPQFVGVGSGQLEVAAVDPSAALQSFTVTLTDLGVATESAALDVRELRLVALTPGAPGNSIRISVTPNLTRAATDWSLLAEWSAGQATQTGPQWDFGALPLSTGGELDAASPRIVFGADPQVYRPWRELKDGEWRFGLSPQLQRTVARGTPVYTVTGDYTVEVTDGTTTETFPGGGGSQIVTFHDLLRALQASTLVQVAGVVAADRSVGGQAAIDVPLRTTAWLLSLGGQVRLQDVVVPSTAPTQSVSVRCVNADTIGAERWAVSGDVSGVLPVATTGQPYTHAAVEFTVPAIQHNTAARGEWNFKFVPTSRTDDEGEPSVCAKPFRLGINARPLTVTFEYRKRPPAQCSCARLPALSLSDQCLGLAPEGGGMALDAEYQTRLEALYEWQRDFINSNTGYAASGAFGFGYVESDTREVEIANLVTAELARCLAEIYEVKAARDQWDIEFAGVASEMLPLQGMSSSGNINARVATPWEAYLTVSYAQWIVPTVRNGYLYRVSTAGTTDGSEPSPWSTGSPQSDADVVYTPEKYWAATEAISPGAVIDPGVGIKYISSAGGTTGTDEPIWGDDTVTDGSVEWSRVTAQSSEIHFPGDVSVITFSAVGRGVSRVVYFRGGWVTGWMDVPPYSMNSAEMLQRAGEAEATGRVVGIEAIARMIGARMDYCRTMAGIVPKSDPSTVTDAGGCWVDHGDPTWWVDVDGHYLPAFTNKPYISSRRDADTGAAYSTKEFGFGLVVACEDRLKIGDQITVRIISVDVERPYSVGDEAIIQTVGAGPAWLSGGITGTDEQTWSVRASAAGALPDYTVPTDGTPPPTYSQAGVDFKIDLGGIRFVLGDVFEFSIEAGQYRWRRDSGAWSSPANIPAGSPAALADGLQLHFDDGAAPSFAAGDAYHFAVHQPHAASHVQDAQPTQWAWDGATGSITLDLGSLKQIDAVAIARYTLPAGATVVAELSTDNIAWTPAPLDVSGRVAVAFVDVAARYLRVSVSNAAGGQIGWVWAGQPRATQHHASSCRRERRWATRRGDTINAARLYAGQGDGWQLEWGLDARNASLLTDADVGDLVSLVDFAQQHDEPLIFVPHHQHPEDAALVRVGDEALAITDLHEWQPDAASARILSAAMTLEPVFA